MRVNINGSHWLLSSILITFSFFLILYTYVCVYECVCALPEEPGVARDKEVHFFKQTKNVYLVSKERKKPSRSSLKSRP